MELAVEHARVACACFMIATGGNKVPSTSFLTVPANTFLVKAELKSHAVHFYKTLERIGSTIDAAKDIMLDHTSESVLLKDGQALWAEKGIPLFSAMQVVICLRSQRVCFVSLTQNKHAANT